MSDYGTDEPPDDRQKAQPARDKVFGLGRCSAAMACTRGARHPALALVGSFEAGDAVLDGERRGKRAVLFIGANTIVSASAVVREQSLPNAIPIGGRDRVVG